MIVKIYLEPGASMPCKYSENAHAWDIKATSRKLKNGCLIYGTGIHIALPEKYNGIVPCLYLYARSSIYKHKLILSNGVGVIDNDYRGEIHAIFYHLRSCEPYVVGERIAQIAASNGEEIVWQRVDKLSDLGDTKRGLDGFGSTGKN